MDKFFAQMYVVLQSGLQDLRTKADDERGATAVEYGLLVALIAGVIIVVVTALGLSVQGAFQDVVDALP
jgi:pilus assembly protein Flp/PilA